jgi:hypothetical protein
MDDDEDRKRRTLDELGRMDEQAQDKLLRTPELSNGIWV